MGPAFPFDYDARDAFSRIVTNAQDFIVNVAGAVRV